MTFKDSISTCLFKKYAVFNGRASLSEYWWFALFKYLLLACCCLIAMLIQKVQPVLIFSVLLILFIPTLAVTHRRINKEFDYSSEHKLGSYFIEAIKWILWGGACLVAVIADILTVMMAVYLPIDFQLQNAYEFFYPCLCAVIYDVFVHCIDYPYSY